MTVNDKTLENVYIIDKNGNKRRIKRIYIGVNGKAKKIADTMTGPYILSEAPTNLSQARDSLAATSIGNYALFGGGYYNGISNVVDAYDTSLVRTTPTPLSSSRIFLAATSIGNYALFGGGSDVVDAYDTSLVRPTPTPLSSSRSSLAATSIGDFALFGGGYASAVVDAYDTSLVRTTPTPLSKAKTDLAATSIGDYALFGGGSGPSNIVDAYSVQKFLV